MKLSLFLYEEIDGWVNLRWRTVTESNNYGFEIQRACDDGIFKRISFVLRKGTLQQPQFYEFKDQPAEPGKYYYRLKQIDFNGDFLYSSIIEVAVSQTPAFQLEQNYPNLFNQNTIVRYEINKDAVVILKIYNLTGQWQEMLVNEY